MSLTQCGLIGLRKSWTSSYDECLLELFIELKNCGKTTCNLFKYEVYNTVTQKLNQKFGTNVEESHIKLRHNAMKKDYSIIKSLLCQPGFRWDGERQMVVADDKVWGNHIAVRDTRPYPYRWRGIPLYDKMYILFEESVTGDGTLNKHISSRVNNTHEGDCDPERVQWGMPHTLCRLIGLRKSWTSSHDECLLELFIELKNCGKTTCNLFKYEVCKTVTQKLNQKFGTNVKESQIKLRHNAMKKDYGIIKSLLCQPGFRWDGEKQMVVADDEVWGNHIAVRRDTRPYPYRWRRIPLYDKMSILFEESVTGDGASNQHISSRVNNTHEGDCDPETVQVVKPTAEPEQVNYDSPDSDSSYDVNNMHPRKRKSTTSGCKRSAHVEVEDSMENDFYEAPSADRSVGMQKNVDRPEYTKGKSKFVATSGYNKSLHGEAEDSIENALYEIPPAAMSKGMQSNINRPQYKRRKSAAASCYNHAPQVEEEDRVENALEENPSATSSKGVHKNMNDVRALYQRCLEDLQNIDELNDAEFSKAVFALKDDKNAIAFMTIRGLRRLIWLRSILNGN